MNRVYFTFLVAQFTLITGCGNIALSLFQSKSAGFVEDPNSPLADLQTKCGVSAADFSDPNFVVVQLNLKSIPVITEGSKDGIDYKVTSLATSSILARAGTSQVTTTATVQSMEAKDSSGTVLTGAALDKVVRPEADAATKDVSGVVTMSSPSASQLLRLSRQEGQFKNMLCALSFTTSMIDATGGNTGEVRFDPPLPVSMNPKAAVSTLESELAASRTFTSNANVVTTKPTWVKTTGITPVQVTWKKVAADITQSSQISGQTLPKIAADVAYEVTITAGSVPAYMLGLSRRRVYYISSSTKQIVAIVDDSGKLQSGTTGKELPPTVLTQ